MWACWHFIQLSALEMFKIEFQQMSGQVQNLYACFDFALFEIYFQSSFSLIIHFYGFCQKSINSYLSIQIKMAGYYSKM